MGVSVLDRLNGRLDVTSVGALQLAVRRAAAPLPEAAPREGTSPACHPGSWRTTRRPIPQADLVMVGQAILLRELRGHGVV